MNPIFDLSIYIPIYLIIDLLLILGFISPNLLVTALGTSLAYYTSTLALLHIDELILVFCNILMHLTKEHGLINIRSNSKSIIREMEV